MFFNELIWKVALGLEDFKHPSVGGVNSEVRNGNNIVVDIFDKDGSYISQNYGDPRFFIISGINLIVAPEQVQIDRLYIRPEFRGRRIGTEFVNHLESVVAETGFKKLSLEPDKEVDDKDYWKNVHGFYVPEPDDSYMYKVINQS